MEVGEEDTFALPGQQITRLVLETVAQMPPPGVGLRTIAGILRGETRANWLSYIARTENWGALFPNSLASVEALLQDLVRAGYIEGKHFVRLTEKGQRALEDANELPVPRRPLKAVPPSADLPALLAVALPAFWVDRLAGLGFRPSAMVAWASSAEAVNGA